MKVSRRVYGYLPSFYRHVLISKRYPHHGAVAFGHVGKALYTIFDYLGVPDIAFIAAVLEQTVLDQLVFDRACFQAAERGVPAVEAHEGVTQGA